MESSGFPHAESIHPKHGHLQSVQPLASEDLHLTFSVFCDTLALLFAALDFATSTSISSINEGFSRDGFYRLHLQKIPRSATVSPLRRLPRCTAAGTREALTTSRPNHDLLRFSSIHPILFIPLSTSLSAPSTFSISLTDPLYELESLDTPFCGCVAHFCVSAL